MLVVHPFGRKLLRVGFNSPVLPESGGRGGGRELGLLRKLIAAADIIDVALYLWLAHLVAAAAALVEDREVWLVGDRSFDEVLVKHWHRGILSWRMAERVRRLVPGFGVTIWLEVKPEVAKVRDGDLDLASYKKLCEAYSVAAERFGWQVVPHRRRNPDRRRSFAPQMEAERRQNPDRRQYPERGRPPESVFVAIVEALGLAIPGDNPDASPGSVPEGRDPSRVATP